MGALILMGEERERKRKKGNRESVVFVKFDYPKKKYC